VRSTLLALSLSMLSKLWGCKPRRAGPHDEILALRADNAKLRALLQSLTGAEGLASNTIDTPPSCQSLVSGRRASTTAACPAATLTFPETSALPLPPLITDVCSGCEGRSVNNVYVLEQLHSRSGAANGERARSAACRIRDPDYTLRHFHDDVAAAFPELGWYMVIREHTSSNTLPETEYQRTIGALFAVYWLARIGIDGERGFCFGVDADWRPNGPPPIALPPAGSRFGLLSGEQKRLAFYESTPWAELERLMVDAGVLRRGADGAVGVSADRMAALLVQTAIHDIMKVDLMRPSVSPEHAPYLGFGAGDTISDHDVALGYVLEHHGHLLPSFQLVTLQLQRAIRFTQAKIRFNNGWLVQAEAPPAAVFSHFKACIRSNAINSADIAFYFAHWLTDLAGAEPTPLRGSEKFCLRFPHGVLASFIESFPIVGQLAQQTETEVFEGYLRQRWRDAPRALGPEPRGPHAVALCRLIVQAQHEAAQKGVFEAFWRLQESDRAVLELEMAQTGLPQQTYSLARGCPKLGPAFLIYYSPALLQTLGAEHGEVALRILAEIYRQARAIWPDDGGSGSGCSTVTLRIDVLKDRTVEAIQQVYTYGEGWFLTKLNDQEGVIEKRSLGEGDASRHGYASVHRRLLELWRTFRDE